LREGLPEAAFADYPAIAVPDWQSCLATTQT
jgi:hypothetical protein